MFLLLYSAEARSNLPDRSQHLQIAFTYLKHWTSAEREHKQTCLVLNNNEHLHRRSIFFFFPPKCHNCRARVTRFFFFFFTISFLLKLLKQDDQKCSETNWEPVVWGFLICETGRCCTKNKWWRFFDCSSLYHYQPLSTLFFKAARCVTRPQSVHLTPKGNESLFLFIMMHAGRKLNLGPPLYL